METQLRPGITCRCLSSSMEVDKGVLQCLSSPSPGLTDERGLAFAGIFSSPDAAAIDAGNYLFTTKPRLWNRLEYGGWIYKTDCGYSYTFSSGNPRNMPLDGIPKPPGTEYAWHSHTDPDAKEDYNFSDWNDHPKTGGDKGWAYRNVPLYLITPTNGVKLYTPTGERTGTVRRVK